MSQIRNGNGSSLLGDQVWEIRIPEESTPVDVMSREEAEQCVSRIRMRIDHIRELVLDLYERQGWISLGYRSWVECVKMEFGGCKSRIYQHLTTAMIERDVRAQVPDLTPEADPNSERAQTLVESQLRELAPLKSDERGDAWVEAVETAPDGKMTAKHVRNVVEKRLYGEPFSAGQSMVDGELVADPPDIADARANGAIPAGAVPEVTTAEPEEEDEAEDEAEDQVGNAAPFRTVQTDPSPAPFRTVETAPTLAVDVPTYQEGATVPTAPVPAPAPVPTETPVDPAEKWAESLPAYAEIANPACRKTFVNDALFYQAASPYRHQFRKSMGRLLSRKNGGPYQFQMRCFLEKPGPEHWVACPSHENGGCAGQGAIDGIGRCPKCHGNGYLIR